MSLDAPLEVMMYPDEEARMREILANELADDTTIVEYGCGGSTMMFADNLGEMRRLISIEHNLQWAEKVQKAIDVHPNSARINLMYLRPDFPPNIYGFAQPTEETPAGLRNYLNPMIDWEDVDFVLVDGVARGPCLSLLAHRLIPRTRVILHDYTGRELWYDWIVRSGVYDIERCTNMLLEMRVSLQG
jgi:hypothetical protein